MTAEGDKHLIAKSTEGCRDHVMGEGCFPEKLLKEDTLTSDFKE